MSKNDAIGIFDSGVGGLTIWNEILKTLPFENTIYISDSANAPYGTKSPQEIIDLSKSSTKKLIEKGVKLVVVACNTATTQAIETLRNEFDITFIGIEPAIKPAAIASQNRSMAVLATQGTLESEHFNSTKDKFTKNIEVVSRDGEGLVAAIENGELHTNELRVLLKSHLDALMIKNPDNLVLGCTHYPLLIPIIRDLIGDKIAIVDSGSAVAKQTKRVLETNNLLRNTTQLGKHELYTSKNLAVLKDIVRELGRGSQPNITYSSLYQSE